MARTIATTTRVDRDGMIDFVRPRHQMILMTRRSNGAVQASPVTGGVDAAGRVVISSYPDRAKSTNVRRTGTASVLVLSDNFSDPWMQVDGAAELLELPDAVEPLVDYFRSISGEHPDWDEYRQAMTEQGNCLIRITPTVWSPIATGGFPARLS